MIQFTAYGVLVKIWPSEIIGVAMLGFGTWAFWRAQTNKRNPIDLAAMFVWPGTKQTSMAMVMTFCGALTATWIIIDLTLRSHLTEGYFTAYIGTLILGKALTQAINAWGDRGPPPPNQPNQLITNAAVVSNAPAPDPPPEVPHPAPEPPPVAVAPRKRPARKRKLSGKVY